MSAPTSQNITADTRRTQVLSVCPTLLLTTPTRFVVFLLFLLLFMLYTCRYACQMGVWTMTGG